MAEKEDHTKFTIQLLEASIQLLDRIKYLEEENKRLEGIVRRRQLLEENRTVDSWSAEDFYTIGEELGIPEERLTECMDGMLDQLEYEQLKHDSDTPKVITWKDIESIIKQHTGTH